MSQSEPGSQDPGLLWWILGIFAGGGLLVMFLIVVLSSGIRAARNDSEAAAVPGAGPRTETVTLGDLFVKPSSITVPEGTDLTLHVMNTGQLADNLKLEGAQPGTADLQPGGMVDLPVGVVSKSVQFWCTVPGHKEAGMVLQLNVTPAVAAKTSSTPAANSGTAAARTGFNPADAKLDPNATPAAGFKAKDPTLVPADGATTHDVTFVMSEKVLEVAPGVKQQMWVFNGQFPGPILHGHLGDVFNVTVVNQGSMAHSIDFHASQTSMNVDMRQLKPGESLVYSFKAEYSGIWMYHCGTPPALYHIGNGMHGAVVIDPPGLAPVAHEYALVQSDVYFGPQGKPGDLAKMQAFQPDAVVFNGYAFQYKFDPIHVKTGDRIRVWVLDAGPSENSSFHIVGTIFDTVFKEGDYILAPNNPWHGGSQAMDLQPAQGGFVEFQVRKPGMYAIVTHKFVNVNKGAMGVLMAD